MAFDDSSINEYNIILFNNINSYEKMAAVDYMHHDFGHDMMFPWKFLKNWSDKVQNYSLDDIQLGDTNSIILRLPSCSNEIIDDYYIYLERLHHVLWRRSYMNYMQYKLKNQLQKKQDTENAKLVQGSSKDGDSVTMKQTQKSSPTKTKYQKSEPTVDHIEYADKARNALVANPLDLDWDKECDVTTLYGPYLTAEVPFEELKADLMEEYGTSSNRRDSSGSSSCSSSSSSSSSLESECDTEVSSASSLDSSSKPILKHENHIHGEWHKHTDHNASVKFNDNVSERLYSNLYNFKDYCVEINDLYANTTSEDSSSTLYYYY
ncbi:hypothetical protein ACO0QE_004720 [Hanseniaspora vineae]